MLDAQTGTLTSGWRDGDKPSGADSIFGVGRDYTGAHFTDTGGASRFFFRADYDEGDVPADTDYHRQINQRSTP